MPPKRGTNRLKLGPIVGHTDHQSTRIWIQVFDDPSAYVLRVQGVGTFPFVSTESPGNLEFRTALAVATGLRPDQRYRYNVLRRGRFTINGRGSFRAMPDPASMANVTFCSISCSFATELGAWPALDKFLEEAQPQFLLMVGDQLYLDDSEDGTDVFAEHRYSPRAVRRQAIVDKYLLNWSRAEVRDVFANIPTYMLWDDHDIRDGWGSMASDSPTLVAKYPGGRPLFENCRAYFEDCRDIYWHFQGCHNPRPSTGADPALFTYADAPPASGTRQAMPYAFRVGRLVLLMLDSRGERDVFRPDLPILGPRQWQFIADVFANLDADVEALAVITPTPIASMDPTGPAMKLMGDRTDDIEPFKYGREMPRSSGDLSQFGLAVVNEHLSSLAGTQLNLGNFKISNIDETRDQWSHKYSRPEQVALLRAAGSALTQNRAPGAPRTLLFVSGDIHVGARFKITCAAPPYEALSVISSGISTVFEKEPVVHVVLSQDFEVAPGIHSSLQEVINEFNFAVVQVLPTGRGAEVQAAIAHAGTAVTLGVDISAYL